MGWSSPESVNFFMLQSMALRSAKYQNLLTDPALKTFSGATRGETMAFMELATSSGAVFRENGFFVVRGLVAPETMAQVREEIVNFVENPGERSDVLSEEKAVKQGEQREGVARYRKLEKMGRLQRADLEYLLCQSGCARLRAPLHRR
jgi:hypothetical protein